MIKAARDFLLAAALLPGFSAGETLRPVRLDNAPWRALLRVQTELGGRCSGFLIAPSVAITAAHCLFLPRAQRFLQPGSVHVLLRYRMGQFDAHARAVRFILPPHYDPRAESSSAGSDRAVLLLDRAIAHPADGLQPSHALPAIGTPVHLAGYGQDRDEVAVAGPACRVTGLRPDANGDVVIAHDCAGTRGTSGAPLVMRDADGAWRAVGVQIEAHVGAVGGLASALSGPPQRP
jgi:protease YdgD